MEIIDLDTEREARTPPSDTPSASLEAALDGLNKILEGLQDADDEKSINKRSTLLSKKAGLIKRLKAAKALENMPSKAQKPDTDPEDIEAEIRIELQKFINQYQPNFVAKNNRFWLEFSSQRQGKTFIPRLWVPVRKSDLNLYHVDLEPKADNPFWRIFQQMLHEQGRWYRDMIYSFDEVPTSTLNLMSPDFLPPVQPQEGEKVHWVFNALIQSLAGGKRENSDHIEQIVLAGYLDPAGNYLRPCQVFDDEGSTGKTLFATTALSTLFGSDMVIPSVDIGVLQGFNAHLAGKVIVFINEVTQEEAHANVLKRVLGSKQFKLEYKGIDATFVDNTAMYFISGNNRGVGAVHFNNNGVDRRYSMHCPDKALWEYIAPHLTNLDMKNPLGKVDKAGVDSWLKRVGQNILSDPHQVGLWLYSLIEKHGDVADVPALHGEDYKKIVAGQKGTPEKVFETIFNDPKFTHIKRKTLFEFFKFEEPSSKMRRGTFYSMADDWLARHNMPIITRLAQRWGSTSADVYCLDNLPPMPQNDDRYYTKNDYGKVNWRVELPS